MSVTKYSAMAIGGGCLISVGIFFNGLLTLYLPPLQASFVIHIIGFIAAWALYAFEDRKALSANSTRVSWWVYGAGVFGALSVMCMGVAVNSPLGISGATVLMMLGQIVYGIFSDRFGLLGSVKRSLTRWDAMQISFLAIGACLLIYKQAPMAG